MAWKLAQGDATAAAKLASAIAKQEVQWFLKKREAAEADDDLLSSAHDQIFFGEPLLGGRGAAL